jgi:hypothetical protein
MAPTGPPWLWFRRWPAGYVNCDHWFAGANLVSGTALGADLLVAEGAVVRAWDETPGDYRYYLAEYAPGRRRSQWAN